MTEPMICYCTCPDAAVAERLAGLLVEAGVAACVNIVPGITSVYRWQGQVETSSEFMLMIKTNRRHYPALEALILREHPYELPEIAAVCIAAGAKQYLEWLDTSLI